MPKNCRDTEQYIIFTAGLVLGMILSYTGLLGFIAGIGTGLFLGNKYDKITNVIIETCIQLINKSEQKEK